MENQTQSFDHTTSVLSETMALTNSTPGLQLDAGFTFLANESRVENVTDETVWSPDCGTFVVDYGIIACVICGIAFVVGVVFCLFGEKLLISRLKSVACNANCGSYRKFKPLDINAYKF